MQYRIYSCFFAPYMVCYWNKMLLISRCLFMLRKIALTGAAALLALSLTACSLTQKPAETTVPTTVPPTTESLAEIEELTLIVDETTISTLDNYPNLKTVDLSGSTCYAAIEDYAEAHPDVNVIYTVSLGGVEVSLPTTDLVLQPGSFHYITLVNNLRYLPNVTRVALPETDLTMDQLDALRAAYPRITIEADFEIAGMKLGVETTELDLSGFDPANLPALVEKLPLLPNLTFVNLMDENGNSPFTMEQVRQIKAAQPKVVVNYTFELFGTTVSSSDEKLDFTNQKLGNEAAEELRAALDILPENVYIKVENCGFDNEVLGAIQQDYPEATIVWRVWYGNQNQLTDAVMIRHVYNLKDNNCENMKYFTKAKYLDLGHNETLTTIEFCAYMPDLEILIVSGSLVDDVTPLANCTKLWWLELAYCAKLTDISALAGCESLRNLNLGFTKVTDLTPVLNLPLKQLHAISNKIPDEMEEEFDKAHPDCVTVWRGKQPYGYGWRYIDNGVTFGEDYLKIREVFDLDTVDKNLKAQEAAKKNNK